MDSFTTWFILENFSIVCKDRSRSCPFNEAQWLHKREISRESFRYCRDRQRCFDYRYPMLRRDASASRRSVASQNSILPGLFLTMKQDGDVKRWYFRDRDGDVRRSRLGIRLIYGGDNAVHGPENIDFSMHARATYRWSIDWKRLRHYFIRYPRIERATWHPVLIRFRFLITEAHSDFLFIGQPFPCITDLVK